MCGSFWAVRDSGSASHRASRTRLPKPRGGEGHWTRGERESGHPGGRHRADGDAGGRPAHLAAVARAGHRHDRRRRGGPGVGRRGRPAASHRDRRVPRRPWGAAAARCAVRRHEPGRRRPCAHARCHGADRRGRRWRGGPAVERGRRAGAAGRGPGAPADRGRCPARPRRHAAARWPGPARLGAAGDRGAAGHRVRAGLGPCLRGRHRRRGAGRRRPRGAAARGRREPADHRRHPGSRAGPPGRLRGLRLRRRGLRGLTAPAPGRGNRTVPARGLGTAVGVGGHVFVVGADLTRLSCDDVLVPTDRSLRVASGWSPLFPSDVLSGSDEEGACAGLARREVPEPAHGRARRLVGLPALGTGWGGAAGKRGALLQELIPVLREAAEEHGFDVALVLRGPSDLAAAQRVRRGQDTGWDLPDALRELAEQLGETARRGQLAVFIGAGVSAAAGLPTWEQLVGELAARSGLDDDLREGLSRLPPQDSAALVARELGRDRLEEFVKERFGPGPYALAHALVADLPVQEFVTTNYDPLVELAASDMGRQVRVLPFEEAEPGSPWLLKLHGDAGHPESVVLTREEYLQFGDTRAALAGVLHSLLLTRHVLFVGTSMLDDDLIRIAHQVRSALRLKGRGSGRRSGTVLALRQDVARARLWEQDVETVAMAPADTPPAEAARRLEVLLDLIGCLSTPPTGYLLDPAYRGLLDEEERALADALAQVADTLGEDTASLAAQELLALLRRLGSGGAAAQGQDDRVQEQRPG